MHQLIALALASTVLLGLAGCTGSSARDRESQIPGLVNEATPTSEIGNTGTAGTAAAGPHVNSQSRTEAGREAGRR